jgi:hypothetical protein
MPALWHGMAGTVVELCEDGMYLILSAEGQKWRVPIAETKIGREEARR